MPFDQPHTSPADAQSAPLVRRLARRYLCVLVLVAGLVVLNEAIIQPALLRLNLYAPAINTAGRQRMLSQRLTKAALALEATTNAATRQSRRDELQTTLAQWKAAHALLTNPSSAGSQSAELMAAWSELTPHFEAMCAAAEQLLRASAAGESRSTRSGAVDELLANESQYLPIMERIVKLLEQSAGEQVARLRIDALLISVSVILLLVGLGWLVVRPATRTIRAQVDGLEACVAQRTHELSETNRALEREIVDHQQAEADKQRLAAQLAHAARLSSLGHLAAGLAHEINQPLTAIANYADACELSLARGDQRQTEVVGYFGEIKRAAKRAGAIVRRIRNFARPSGKTRAPISLRALVREVAELCRFELEQADVRLSLNLHSGDDLVQADGIQVQQVLVNLIENAIHALDRAPAVERSIGVSTHFVGDMVRVDVSDTGPGFGASDPDDVFTPYFTTKENGLGIGLSLSREIIARHGGKIWAEAQPQGGARFSFTLSIATPPSVAKFVKIRAPDANAGIVTNSATAE